MKRVNQVKRYAAILLIAGLATGCASTPTKTDTSAEDEGAVATESDQDQERARQAIAAAKAALADASRVSTEWRDTGKMIKGAEDALKAGDSAKAIAMADMARRQAENALNQKTREENRFAESVAVMSMSAAMQGDSYRVVRGDNLWSISSRSYGNPYQWPLIYKANHDKIRDADLIYPGQEFAIARDSSAADIGAAIRHARTRGAWSIGRVEASDMAYLDR